MRKTYGIIKETRNDVVDNTLATKNKYISVSSSSKPARSGSNEDTLQTVQDMVRSWLDYRKQLLPSWERDTKLYNNERYERHFEGVSDTFVPMTHSTIETMVSALATGDLSTDFLPQDIYEYLKDRFVEGYDEQATEMSQDEFLAQAISGALNGGIIEDDTLEVLNAAYDYWWDCGDWNKALEKLIKSGLKIGNGAWWMVWEDGKPKLIYVPFPDYVFDPKGSSDDTVKFAGRRYLASLKDLKAETIIDENGKVKKRYTNLSKVTKKPQTTKEEKTDKQLKEDMLFGSTVGTTDKDQVEVIEIRTEDRAYTLVNRTVLAEDVENPIVSQAKLIGMDEDQIDRLIKIPGITWANYEDESLFIGKSETSTFWKEQERLNDATNQKSDAVTRALLQTYIADPQLKSQSKSMGVPGAVIFGTAGQFQAIPPAQVPSAAFNEEISIKNNIRETTATDQIVKGVGATGDVTATEANLQVAQSGQRIEMKIESLARGPLKRAARLALQYARLFIMSPFIIPQRANNGFGVMLYDPKRYNYEYEPKITLTIQNQNNRRKEQAEALQMYQILIQDPTNNLEEVKKLMLPKIVDLDKDEIERIMKQPEQSPEVAMAQPIPGTQTPEQNIGGQLGGQL